MFESASEDAEDLERDSTETPKLHKFKLWDCWELTILWRYRDHQWMSRHSGQQEVATVSTWRESGTNGTEDCVHRSCELRFSICFTQNQMRRTLTYFKFKNKVLQKGWGHYSMVTRLPSPCKTLGLVSVKSQVLGQMAEAASACAFPFIYHKISPPPYLGIDMSFSFISFFSVSLQHQNKTNETQKSKPK